MCALWVSFVALKLGMIEEEAFSLTPQITEPSDETKIEGPEALEDPSSLVC